MEVRESSRLPCMPPNYVSLAHLKARWLKEQELIKLAEIDGGVPARREKAPAVHSEIIREREKSPSEVVVVVPELQREITGEGERRDKAPAAVAVPAVQSEIIGERGRARREKSPAAEVAPALQRERGRERREKVPAVQREMFGERGRERREKVPAVQREIMGEGERERREKAAVEEISWARAEKKEEGGSGKRREKEKNGGGAETERREKVNAKRKKYRKNKGKAKVDETLGGAEAEKVPERQREKVGVGFEETEEGGNRKMSEKVRRPKGKKKREKGKAKGKETRAEKVMEDSTVVMNGRVWVKKVVPNVVDPTAEIERKFGDFSLRERNGREGRRENRKDETGRKFGGNPRGVWKNVSGDPMAEIGLKIGDLGKSEKKKRGEARDVKENLEGNRRVEIKRRSGDRKVGNSLGKKIGLQGLNSSLVWVRKEDKSEVCVAGNCGEGMLAKAGESEKKPGRGRP